MSNLTSAFIIALTMASGWAITDVALGNYNKIPSDLPIVLIAAGCGAYSGRKFEQSLRP